MAPYKVVLIPPKGDRLDLVLPFGGGGTFHDLTAAVLQRASKYRSLPSNIRQEHLKLCLGSDDGYLIEPNDVVQDVITTADVLFLCFLDDPATSKHVRPKDPSAATALQIRVITPNMAQRTPEVRHISLLQNGRCYMPATTLREINTDIAHHLHLPRVPSQDSTETECNCKLAELLVKRGIWDKVTCSKHNIMGCGYTYSGFSPNQQCARCSQPLMSHPTEDEYGTCQSYILRRSDLPCGHVIHSQCLNTGGEYDCPSSCYAVSPIDQSSPRHVLVVSGQGHIESLDLESNTHSALMSRLTDRFGEDFTDDKSVFCKGGCSLAEEDIYTRIPVVAVCASNRHQSNLVTSDPPEGPSHVKLDIHTIEGPINTQNLDLSLEHARLADIAVNGVLTLYVVERKSDGNEKKAKGQDAMFTAAPHWKLPSIQSDRGMAAVLASLRVFAHIIGSEEFDDYRQNEVLRIVHLLTRFPPAVRAVHILMDGKTLQSNESAALVQSIAAVAEELIPLSLIANDMRRSLEGARLVLGLILYRVRRSETKRVDDSKQTLGSSMPYINAYHTIDLRDVKTLEPVTEPVLTNLGLVNRSVFDAYSASALLKHSPSCYLTDCGKEDPARIRVALLYGGVTLEASYYEADAIGAAFSHSAGPPTLDLDLNSLSSDIPYLASLCEETKLVVVAPRQLSNAKAPSLTLDRHGNMAVYTGRAACAAPGHDHAVFHPLTGAEENVDVTIVSQKLEPILQTREKDGTNVFDLFSATFRRKEATPTELIVFCVDCSYSMNNSSDFAELTDDETLPSPSKADDDDDVVLEDEDDTNVSLEEIKTWMCDHESYEDILHIIHHYPPYRTQDVVAEILEFLRALTTRDLAHLATKRRGVSRWATASFSRRTNSATERQMNALRRTLTGLNIHQQTLSDFLEFTGRNPSFTSKEFRWSYGEALPSAPASSTTHDEVDIGDFCVIPQEYVCPISQVVFEDPVGTSDGFTFDRKAIERWYRIRRSSPLTGLSIQDTTLRHQEPLANQIRSWVKAEDVIGSLPSTPKRTRLSTRQPRAVIDFIAPTVRFTREIPGTATLLDLYKIAFRGMRGLYARFSLHMGGTFLPSSEENMVRKGVAGSQTITINPNHTPQSGTSGNPGGRQEEMCLVRIYSDRNTSHESLSYWVPLHSEHTLGSVLFRNWRNSVQHRRSGYCDYDRSVWGDLKDGGDGTRIGSRYDSWTPLSTLLRNCPRVEIREHEPLYERLTDMARNRNSSAPDSPGSTIDRSSGERQYQRRRMVKLHLFDYKTPQSLEQEKLQKLKRLTRMAVTKQVFSAFINRLIAYNFPTSVGLVTFGTEAEISQKLTDVVENFRQAVDKMEAKGDTALWDAIDLAADHLVEMSRAHRNIKKRIICLSDGSDTSSIKNVGNVCRMLMQQDIVVDSVCIGEENNSALRAVSYLTGGYKFVPHSVEEASALCELEPVLSIHERPPISRPMSLLGFNFSRASHSARPDPVTQDQYPARKIHANLYDAFVRIGKLERAATSGLSEPAPTSTSSVRSRRLLLEIRDMASRPHPSYDVYVSESNIGFWKIVLQGPTGSAYASGAFVLYLDMGEDYPRRAPSGRFVTPIFHPNVNRHGRICHSIFDRNWTVDTTNKQILDTVFGLLLVPEFSDPINTIVTLNFYWDEVAFREEVQRHIQKHAKMSRVDLGRSILGEGERA